MWTWRFDVLLLELEYDIVEMIGNIKGQDD